MDDTAYDVIFQKLSSYHAYDNYPNYHIHNFYEIYLLLEGDINFYVQQSCYHVTSSSLAIINSLEPHKASNNKNAVFSRIYFHIPPSFMEKYSLVNTDLSHCFTNRCVGNNNILSLTKHEEKYIIDIYNNLLQVKNSDNNNFGNKLLFDTYIIQLLIYINKLYKGQSFAVPKEYSHDVQFIIDYIDSHITENISLDILSKKLSRDKYYLSHKFKKETDTSILHYLILSRISKAKQLLQEGLNVTETCYNCGFYDYSNFITTFKKITGYTPKKYQQNFSLNR